MPRPRARLPCTRPGLPHADDKHMVGRRSMRHGDRRCGSPMSHCRGAHCAPGQHAGSRHRQPRSPPGGACPPSGLLSSRLLTSNCSPPKAKPTAVGAAFASSGARAAAARVRAKRRKAACRDTSVCMLAKGPQLDCFHSAPSGRGSGRGLPLRLEAPAKQNQASASRSGTRGAIETSKAWNGLLCASIRRCHAFSSRASTPGAPLGAASNAPPAPGRRGTSWTRKPGLMRSPC